MQKIKAQLNASNIYSADETLGALAAQCRSLADDEVGAVVELLSMQAAALHESTFSEEETERVIEQLERIKQKVCIVDLRQSKPD